MFWRNRCGLPWRDLPPQYGHWKTVYNRHRRWSGDGTWVQILDELRRDADAREGPGWTVGVDSRVVRARQHPRRCPARTAGRHPRGGPRAH
ncbi:transposase [Pseudonocardia sp. H11422]|uniref:transposase n=1 Tax=Pseudonocardia sp. H11422 TaxID=2835866 RepID=UPI001BDC87F1